MNFRLQSKISIVEFASQEDSQRAVRELSETPLLGRPVFIREVGNNITFQDVDCDTFYPGPRDRIQIRGYTRAW